MADDRYLDRADSDHADLDRDDPDQPDSDPWANDPLFTAPLLAVPAMLRAARHFADLSQRELAARVGISKSCLGDIESGDVSASFALVVRLMEATGLRVQVLGPFAMPLQAGWLDHVLDKGGRHWPGHLDVRQVVDDSDWWFSRTRPGQRQRPDYTADWHRMQGRPRNRRTAAEMRRDRQQQQQQQQQQAPETD